VEQPEKVLSYRERQKMKGFQIEDIMPMIHSQRTNNTEEEDNTNK